MGFRDDFTWGTATAAYQIEGAHAEDGKGPSVWDQMSHWAGKIYMGDTGDVACDHYHRLEEDLDLMAQLKLKGYRFSISWPRCLPEGVGRVNEAGLDFYDRLVDGLLARGIQPWATLFHWDYPLALYHRGGWLSPDAPEWFAEYATVIAKRLGDRVQHWMTLNEPQIFVGLGHRIGVHAPGLKLPPSDLARMVHQVLVAHGKGCQALRSSCAKDPVIGWAPAFAIVAVEEEDRDNPEAVAAAAEEQFACDVSDSNFVDSASLWCDPVFNRGYPEAFIAAHGHALPKGWEKDLPVIAERIDFCGMNIYAAWQRHHQPKPGQIAAQGEGEYKNGYPRTLFGWPVTPEALYWGPRFMADRYGAPIVITENGMSGHDWVHLDGCVHDHHRIDFTTRYLRELKRAADEGIDLRGYFHWSLMDNFEWAEGYKHRFGLIHVDFNSGKRTVKDSGCWYRDVIESNGAQL